MIDCMRTTLVHATNFCIADFCLLGDSTMREGFEITCQCLSYKVYEDESQDWLYKF